MLSLEEKERISRNRTISQLQAIKGRYFRPVISRFEGLVIHHGDCETYRATDVYGYAPCTCGLLHDLRPLGEGIAEKLNPNYYKDYRKQEYPNCEYMTEEEMKATIKIEIALGQKFNPMTDEEKQLQDEEDWKLIEEVFGESYVGHAKARITN